MQSRIVVNSQEESLLSTHKVLRNTYFLLGLTMAFSAVVAYISMSLNLPLSKPHRIARRLLRFTFCHKPFSNSAWGDFGCIRVYRVLWVTPLGQF